MKNARAKDEFTQKILLIVRKFSQESDALTETKKKRRISDKSKRERESERGREKDEEKEEEEEGGASEEKRELIERTLTATITFLSLHTTPPIRSSESSQLSQSRRGVVCVRRRNFYHTLSRNAPPTALSPSNNDHMPLRLRQKLPRCVHFFTFYLFLSLWAAEQLFLFFCLAAVTILLLYFVDY